MSDKKCDQHETRAPEDCLCERERIRKTAERLNLTESDAEKYLRGEPVNLNE